MTSVETMTKALRDYAYAVPEDVRNAALTVAADLAAERKRREGLEEELHLERLAHTGAVTRAEQAERERDEARKDAEALKTVLAAERVGYQQVLDERDCAGADNAALLDGLRTARDPHAFNTCHGTDCACGVVDLLDADHPGAALLEEIKSLRSDLAKLEESACGTCAPDQYATPEARKVACALERMRALEAFREDMAKAVDGWGHAEDCPSGYEDAPDDACECVNGEVRKMLEAVKP